jgi:hypothetical protein
MTFEQRPTVARAHRGRAAWWSWPSTRPHRPSQRP